MNGPEGTDGQTEGVKGQADVVLHTDLCHSLHDRFELGGLLTTHADDSRDRHQQQHLDLGRVPKFHHLSESERNFSEISDKSTKNLNFHYLMIEKIK